jgi:hypothetical protein
VRRDDDVAKRQEWVVFRYRLRFRHL